MKPFNPIRKTCELFLRKEDRDQPLRHPLYAGVEVGRFYPDVFWLLNSSLDSGDFTGGSVVFGLDQKGQLTPDVSSHYIPSFFLFPFLLHLFVRTVIKEVIGELFCITVRCGRAWFLSSDSEYVKH